MPESLELPSGCNSKEQKCTSGSMRSTTSDRNNYFDKLLWNFSSNVFPANTFLLSCLFDTGEATVANREAATDPD